MADLWLQFVLMIDATLRVATPLILCAMAGLFSERSGIIDICLLYTSPSPRDVEESRMPSSA